MSTITRKAAFAGLASLGAIALLAGCASAPATDTASAGASDFVPCMVSDSGGFDDKSFNQSGYEGLQSAATELGATPITVESAAETDFAPNIQSLVDQGCNLITTVGFLLADATKAAATANPDINFAIIDDLRGVRKKLARRCVAAQGCFVKKSEKTGGLEVGELNRRDLGTCEHPHAATLDVSSKFGLQGGLAQVEMRHVVKGVGGCGLFF